MSRTNLDRVVTIVRRELGVEADTPVLHDTALDDLGADSLDLIEIVMEMEKEFGVDIREDRLIGDGSPSDAAYGVRIADLVAAVEAP